MSIHKSLIPASKKLKRHRNVLTKDERIVLLTKDGRWTEGQSVFGLVKVRNIMARAKAKVKKEVLAAEAAAAGDAAAPADAAKKPAADAAKKPAADAAKKPAADAAKKPAKK
jgi:small basic protein (TIGR04137 family)